MITDVSEWLRSNGMTPSELSEELGLPRSQISRFIAKEEEPDRVVGWALVGLGSVRTKAKGPQTSDAALAMPVAALAQDFADDSWTARTARLALPILVEIAQGNPRQITYADLHEEVVKRGGKPDIGTLTKYAFPLGRVASAMERLDGVPPITALVVSGGTRLPSDGINRFIKEYLELRGPEAKKLNDQEGRREIMNRVWRDIFAYKHWPDVLKRLGLTGNPRLDL